MRRPGCSPGRPVPTVMSHFLREPLMQDVTARKATLFRMVTPQHVCPYGTKAKDLLER